MLIAHYAAAALAVLDGPDQIIPHAAVDGEQVAVAGVAKAQPFQAPGEVASRHAVVEPQRLDL